MKGDEAAGLGEGSASKIKILSIKVILGLVQITKIIENASWHVASPQITPSLCTYIPIRTIDPP